TTVTNGQTSPVNFGTVQQGQTGPIVTFTITNGGGQTLSITSVSAPTGFAVVSPAPPIISAGGKGTFSVQLKTTAAGTNSGNVSIVNGVVTNSPYTFAVTGIVTPLPTPRIQVSLGGLIL